ncbi:MAG: DUF6119 family protein [Nitrospirales bacterium]
MPKFNLYRIPKTKQPALITKLESVGLTRLPEKQKNGYSLNFYFSKKPDSIAIWWLEIYKDFFDQTEQPQNQIYFAVLIVSNDHHCYAISLGKAHFYLRPFCDSDFGLELAERIVDETELRIKNSKFFKSKKSKTITTYHQGSPIDSSGGESWHYLKAKTINKVEWGEVASFGTSTQLCLPINPFDLPNLIERIEVALKTPRKFLLPKTTKIDDQELMQILDNRLVQAISKTGPGEKIKIDDVMVSGVDFIFQDENKYSLYQKGHWNEKGDPQDLTLEALTGFVHAKGLTLESSINDIHVQIIKEHGKSHSESIKVFLDYTDDERFCLIDGKWHQFNQSYIDFLADEVDQLQIDYEEKFDISSDMNEPDFNCEREKNDGFTNYDKKIESLDGKFRVEKLDLYKNQCIYFVKIGSTQKQNYVIDQALNVIKIFQSTGGSLNINGQDTKIKHICLWMILKKKNKIDKLSELRSLILQMKLVNWKKETQDAGYTPNVKINYKN